MPLIDDVELNQVDYNRRIHFWNRVYRVALIVLLLIIFGMQLASNTKIQQTQAQQQDSTIEARRLNLARQDKIINHIDCVLLLTKKYPKVNFQALNYDQLKKYLNDCVAKE